MEKEPTEKELEEEMKDDIVDLDKVEIPGHDSKHLQAFQPK